ncbi:hypothetical protein KCU85_g9522, partial [Aureobasidium melanogenum]
MGLGAILEVVGIFCLASHLVDWPNPICAFGGEDTLSIETDDPAQALKERLKTMPDSLGIEIPDGPIGQAEAERIMSTAISAMKAQATVGPDAMSQDELAEFLARLDTPKPTTMVTVATSIPTKSSTPERPVDLSDLSDEELKRYGLERNWDYGFWQIHPCGVRKISASPWQTQSPPLDEFSAGLDVPKPTKRSDETPESDHSSEEEPESTIDERLRGSRLDALRRGKHCPLWTPFCWKRSAPDAISDADHSSEEELKKAADEGPEAAFIFCIPTPWMPLCI